VGCTEKLRATRSSKKKIHALLFGEFHCVDKLASVAYFVGKYDSIIQERLILLSLVVLFHTKLRKWINFARNYFREVKETAFREN